jgi:hypothetical protein
VGGNGGPCEPVSPDVIDQKDKVNANQANTAALQKDENEKAKNQPGDGDPKAGKDQGQKEKEHQDSPTQSGGGRGGGRGKGERRRTSKPDKPTKGVRPIRDGSGKIIGYWVPTPDGKGARKTLDWGTANGISPADFKKVALGAAAVATVGLVIHTIIATAPEWGPWALAALAF